MQNLEFPVTFPDQSTQSKLRVVSKVGEGKFKVYHVYSSLKKTSFALKTFPNDSFGKEQYEKEQNMFKLSHPNIIKHIPAEFPSNTGFFSIMTEFAKHGDFFGIVVGGHLNSEIIIRSYFHQLIAGLEYIHSQGMAHLDLKLENLMLGSDYNLKIIDFDQSQALTDRELLSRGTKGFRAPEIIEGHCQNYCAADVYSAGVVLYAMKAQEYPFAEILVDVNGKNSRKLKDYTSFMTENKTFWEKRAYKLGNTSMFSQEFKELINGMLEYNVEKRFTLEDIKKSKWYNGPILVGKDLKQEVKFRLIKMSEEKTSEFCN